jgi:hypothetical protein
MADLSIKAKTFSNYISKHLSELGKKTEEELIAFVKDAKNHCSVSDQYLEKVLTTISKFYSTKQILRYLADIMLKGADLGVIQVSCLSEFIKKFSKSEQNEFIIKTMLIC